MASKIRWGILGTGSIARQFVKGLAAVPDAEVAAVGSRAQETADKFGDEFSIPRRHGSYADLAADTDVDAIYVATPHSVHKDATILCLEAGKAVICEKPFAINASQAQAMIGTARKKGVFLMEAMWTRFLPAIVKVREWLAEGAIGDVHMVTADFGFRAGVDPESRLFNPELGGGGLLDVGGYTVSFASMIFGDAPSRIASMAALGKTGVDERGAMILGYDRERFAVLYTAVRTNTPQTAYILGSDGRIEVPSPFWCTTKAKLSAGDREEKVEGEMEGNGYNYEAVEVMNCLREGKLESDVMPLDESLRVMETLDRIREQWGLKYPME